MSITAEDIVEFYRELLDSIDITSNSEDMLCFKSDNTPLLLDGKRLVLPTRENLSKGANSKTVFFHPLSESLSRGESDVCIKIRKLINLKLTSTIAETITALLELASDKDIHSELTPRQSKLLDVVHGVNKKTPTNISKVLSKIKLGPKESVVNIYLKRGGELKNKKYTRIAVVTFPLLKLFDDPDRKVLGVPLRVSDVDNFKSLFEYLLPNHNDYSRGTTGSEVPFLTVLLQTFKDISEELNAVIEIHKDRLAEYDVKPINVDYVNRLKEVIEYRSLIPSQDGNIGFISETINSIRDEENSSNYNRVESEPKVVRDNRPKTSPLREEPIEHVREPYKEPPVEEPDEDSDTVSFSELMSTQRSGGRDVFYNEPPRGDSGGYRDSRYGGRDYADRGFYREEPIDPRDRYIDPRDTYIHPRDRYIDPRDQYIDPRDRYVDPRDQYRKPTLSEMRERRYR